MAAAVRSFGFQRYDNEKIGADEARVNALPEAVLLSLRHKTVHVILPGGSPLNYPVYIKDVSELEAREAERCGRERIGPPIYRTSSLICPSGGSPRFKIVMLKLDGDAISIFGKASTPKERQLSAMYRIAERVAKLHRDTFHGDMKGDNVVVSLDPTNPTGAGDDIVLIDYGRSGEFTLEYCSPEILRCHISRSYERITTDALKKADVYALGMMLIAHISCSHTLMGRNGTETFHLRSLESRVLVSITHKLPTDCPSRSELIGLLTRTLSPNPDERQTAREFAATLFGLLPTETQEQMRERGFVLEGDERPLAAPGEENGAPSFGGSASASASP